MSITAPTLLTVNLDALRDNYILFKSMTSADVAGVLKADAYGCGAEKVFEALRAEGCGEFFVATPDEAIALRAINKDAEIYVLGGVYKGAEKEYQANDLIPVLNSLHEIKRWAAQAKNLNSKLPCAIHIDTGMNRLGLGEKDTKSLVTDRSVLDALDVKIIMTHFACSDEKDHSMNDAQALIFNDFVKEFPDMRASLCNSSGLFRNPDWHHDLVRPGYALYGGNPTPETTNPMRRVVDLSVRILQSRLGIKGTTAGYNATHVFDKDTNLATVSLGYADGFLRGGSNRAKLYANGKPCPVVGRVSMDLVIVDVGDSGFKEGDWLEVLGPHQSVDQLAADCGTIGYEILTSLSRRAHRIYRD